MDNIAKLAQWLRLMLGIHQTGHWTLSRDGELEWEYELETPCS